MVNQFHKLSRTVEFDLFGFINLEILNLKVGSSTEFTERFKFEKFTILDKVEKAGRWDLHVSDTVRAGKIIKC